MLTNKQASQVEIREKMRGGEGHAEICPLVQSGALPAKMRLMSEITLKSGCSIGFHQHMGETEVFYFTAGQGQADDDGVLVDVKQGDVLVTQNAGHAVSNNGNEDLVFTAVIVLDA